MLRHVIAPASFFTQVPNEILRHPRLSSDAVRLLTWQLSLPESTHQPLSETADRAGIKRAGFLRAKRQLVSEGFLHEWRQQGAGGRWSTTQLISNVPLSAETAAAVRDGRPAGGIPTAGEPGSLSVGRSQKNTEENTPNPPSPPSASAHDAAPTAGQRKETLPETTTQPPTAASSVPASLTEQAALALAAISHSERRLRLSGQDVAGLAPIVGEWFQRGASLTDLRDVLTSGLPQPVHSPAGLVRNRLIRKMPDTPTPAEQPTACSPSRLAGTRECQGAHVQTRLFRPVADEVLCPRCRHETTEADQARHAVAATLRGMPAVRAALQRPVSAMA
ncbi:hypothetical protein [Streptomyces sp. NPDC002537]